MTRDKALNILETKDPLTDGWEIADARSFLEGFDEGVRESAKVPTGDVLITPDEFDGKTKLQVFALLERVSETIFALLEKK